MDSAFQFVPVLKQLIDSLQQIKGEKGVKYPIVPGDGSTLTPNTASNADQKRHQVNFIKLLGQTLKIGSFDNLNKYKKIASIFAEEFQIGKFKPREVEILSKPKVDKILPIERTTTVNDKPADGKPVKWGVISTALGALGVALASLLAGLQSDEYKGLLKIITKITAFIGGGLLKLGFKLLLSPFTALMGLFDKLSKVNILDDAITKIVTNVKALPTKILGVVKIFGGYIINSINLVITSTSKILTTIFKSSIVTEIVEKITNNVKGISTTFTRLLNTKLVTTSANLVKIVSTKLLGGVSEIITNTFNSVTNLFTNVSDKPTVISSVFKKINIGGMVGKFGKYITPFLKKLPIVGTLINIGFAISRFNKGDVIGGMIDILSGISVMVPGAGTALSFAFDGLNMLLDFNTKEGEDGQKKTKLNILKDWGSNLWLIVNTNVIEPINNWFDNMFTTIKGIFSNIPGFKELGTFTTNIATKFTDNIINPFTTAIDNICTDMGKFLTNIFTPFTTAIDFVSKQVTSSFTSIYNTVVGNIKSIFPATIENLSKQVGKLFTTIYDTISNVINFIPNTVTKISEWFKTLNITGLIDDTLTGIKKLISWMIKPIKMVKDAVFSNNTTSVSNVDVSPSSTTVDISLAETNKILNEQLNLQRAHIKVAELTNNILVKIMDGMANMGKTTLMSIPSDTRESQTFTSNRELYEQSSYYVSP